MIKPHVREAYLAAAVTGSFTDVCKLLPEMKDDPDGLRLGMRRAVLNSHELVIAAMLDHGVSVKSPEEALVATAILGGKENAGDVLSLLLSRGAPVDAPDKDGNTALRLAVESENAELAAFLIEKGADINLPDKEGTTPLMRAAYLGEVTMVKLLLEKGAPVGSVDKNGSTALMWAVGGFGDSLKKTRLLLKAGASPLAVDNHCFSVLDVAREEGRDGAIADEIRRAVEAEQRRVISERLRRLHAKAPRCRGPGGPA